MNDPNTDSGDSAVSKPMSAIETDSEREAFKRILQVLDEEGLNKVQKVIVLTGAIRRVTGIE